MWNDLKSHAARIEGRTLLGMFDDVNRAGEFAVEMQSMRLDYSKTQIDKDIRDDLLKLADQAGVSARRDASSRAKR